MLYFNCIYIRNKEILSPSNCQANSLEISPNNHKMINQLLTTVSKSKAVLLNSFDFSINNFASPELFREVKNSNNFFKRTYIYYKINGHDFLVIFSKFPTGINILRSCDSVWAIPIGTNNLNLEERDQLLLNILKDGVLRGYSFPGVIIAFTDECSQKDERRMFWSLGHPEVLKCLAGE